VARPDPRRAKVHRNYTIAEAADLFGVHRNTVRAWTRSGLPSFKVKGTVLILGCALRDYLAARRSERRVSCPQGSMYCVACRAPRRPPDGMVEALPVTATTVNLRGLCPTCGSLMHRRASIGRLAEIGFGGPSLNGSTSAPRG
jgi:excisionase family DNA binding protein